MRTSSAIRSALLFSAAATAMLSVSAAAQSTAPDSLPQATEEADSREIIVTGSRI